MLQLLLCELVPGTIEILYHIDAIGNKLPLEHVRVATSLSIAGQDDTNMLPLEHVRVATPCVSVCSPGRHALPLEHVRVATD